MVWMKSMRYANKLRYKRQTKKQADAIISPKCFMMWEWFIVFSVAVFSSRTFKHILCTLQLIKLIHLWTLAVCPSICMAVCCGVCMFVCLSVCLSVCPWSLSKCLSVCLSVCIMSVCLSNALSLCIIPGIRSQSKPHDIMHEVYRAMKTLGYVSETALPPPA